MRHPVLGFALAGFLTLSVLLMLAGFVPDRGAREVRRPLREAMPLPERADKPITRPLSRITWQIREPLGSRAPSSLLTERDVPSAGHSLLGFEDGDVEMRGARGADTVSLSVFAKENDWHGLLSPALSALSLLRADAGDDAELEGAAFGYTDDTAKSLPSARVRVRQGVVFADGEPLHLSLLAPMSMPSGFQVKEPLCTLSPQEEARTARLLRALALYQEQSTQSLLQRAARYRVPVEMYAAKYGLRPALVYGLMYTESSFNPHLISNRAAHGLMQVVPSTAGGEVHRWLGFEGTPSGKMLLDPIVNIKYGTAYVHLLLTRHLGGVKDPVAREYCALAAYNIGINGMLRAFGSDKEQALDVINAMSADEVLTYLQTRLPARETRHFMRKVLANAKHFVTLVGDFSS